MVQALMGIRLCIYNGKTLHVYLNEETLESQLTLLQYNSGYA